MSEEKLLNCPFCGKHDAVALCTAAEIDDYADDFDHYAVVCDATLGGCGATGGYEDNRPDAAKKWNNRFVKNVE